MFNRLSVNGLLKSVIAVLVAAVTIQLALGAWESWNKLNDANRIVAVTNASDHVFTALHNLRLDRASSLRDIPADRQFTSLTPQLVNARAAEMPA